MCVVTTHMVRVCTALVQVQACVRGTCAVCAWWVHVMDVSSSGICVLVSGLCVYVVYVCCVCSDVCNVVHMCVLVCEVCVSVQMCSECVINPL